MKPAEKLMKTLHNFISSFENTQKYEDFLNEVADFPHFLFFANDFAKNKDVTMVKEIDLENIILDFANNYTLMVWGKNFSENKEELFKRLPALNTIYEGKESAFNVLKTLVLKTTEYCYENSYKAKYFNEYIINFKEQQYYLRGTKEIKPVVAFDLDGTVINSNERIRLMQEKKDKLSDSMSKKDKGKAKFKILKEFHSSVESDVPYEHMVNLINEFRKKGFEIAVLTARPNEYIELNKEFLNKWNIQIDTYIGRPIDNGFPDTEGKYTWLNENLSKERVRGFFEDREEIIKYFKQKEKVKIYDVNEYHNNRTEEKMKALVKDCIKRKNICEEYFKLSNEKEDYKNFYRKAEEYYEKRRGIPFSTNELVARASRNDKFRANIS